MKIIDKGLGILRTLQPRRKEIREIHGPLSLSFARELRLVEANGVFSRNCDELLYIRDRLNFLHSQTHSLLLSHLMDIKLEKLEFHTFKKFIVSQLPSLVNGYIPIAPFPDTSTAVVCTSKRGTRISFYL